MNFQLTTTPSPEDQRDYLFVPTIAPYDFAPSTDLVPYVYEVEDQLHLGSCVANSVLSQCELIANQHGKPVDLSRMFLYNATKQFEGRMGQEGLYPRDAYHVMRTIGAPLESAYPYDPALDNINPPADMYTLAQSNQARRYEAVIPPMRAGAYTPQQRIDRIRAALNEGHSVGVAFHVTPSIFSMRGPWQTQTYELESGTSGSAGGHQMTIVGDDAGLGRFIAQNSWGKQWGDGGFGGFTYDIVTQGFFEAWIVRDFNGMNIPPKPGIWLEHKNSMRIEARIIPRAHEIGKRVNIWVGGELNGSLYLRGRMGRQGIMPVPNEFLSDMTSTDTSGALDYWYPYDGIEMTPTFVNVELTPSLLVRAVHWKDLSGFPGGKIYLAYGTSPMDWNLACICKL